MADLTHLSGDDYGEFGVPLHTIEKNDKEQVRFSINEFKKREYIDIRTFSMTEDGFRPTKKGVTLKPTFFQELLRGVLEIGVNLNEVNPDIFAEIDENYLTNQPK